MRGRVVMRASLSGRLVSTRINSASQLTGMCAGALFRRYDTAGLLLLPAASLEYGSAILLCGARVVVLGWEREGGSLCRVTLSSLWRTCALRGGLLGYLCRNTG